MPAPLPRAQHPDLDPAYARLAEALDTLPSGFPATPGGVELRLLAKIFEPAEAALCASLRLAPERPAEVASRLGNRARDVEHRLARMWRRGLIEGVHTEAGRAYRLVPFIVGIFEWQLDRMDAELARLWEDYAPTWGMELMAVLPQLFLVVPAESALPSHSVEPYHQASAIVKAGRAFRLRRCVCRTERQAAGKGCDGPMETCLAISARPDAFDDDPISGRRVSQEEALEVLRRAERAGLVHNVHNQAAGHGFLCNCCSCCCGLLRAARRYRLSSRAFNLHFRAVLDPAACLQCGRCAEERCPVEAIDRAPEGYGVIERRCLGCGLCVTTCPGGAITLEPRPPGQRLDPPADLLEWMEQRARARGVPFDRLR